MVPPLVGVAVKDIVLLLHTFVDVAIIVSLAALIGVVVKVTPGFVVTFAMVWQLLFAFSVQVIISPPLNPVGDVTIVGDVVVIKAVVTPFTVFFQLNCGLVPALVVPTVKDNCVPSQILVLAF